MTDVQSSEDLPGTVQPEDEAVPESRRDEYEQLVKLLMDHCVVADEETLSRARWIAQSALKPGHLWRGMGVSSRDDVRVLLRRSFPELEAANDRDMRWKKFLYRRMCGWAGFST